MKYDVISADCHVDLIWLPPDLFTANASAAFSERVPYVTEGPRGKEWVTKNGSSFGLMNGMGSAGRPYIPGQIYRSDRMASTGLYDDGKNGIRRPTDPDLRLKDQERDGVQAEILYGILGATIRIKDDEAAGEMLRIYNEWLADFCATHPDRYAGLACIPNHDADAAIGEIERVARRGVARGLEISRRHDMAPLWDPWWNPVWDAVAASGLPLHFHTIGGGNRPDTSKLDPKMPPSEYWRRQCYATYQTDPIGIKLVEEIGERNIMWASDFPHPDGIWPDSQEYIQKELGHLPEDTRHKIVCENAAKLYRFVN